MEPLIAKALFVCGATATGKSARAVMVAQEVGGEVVNGDAFQLFRGVDVLTAAPDPTARALVPHHLFGVLDPGETNDAYRYRELALPVIESIIARGATPVIVGGSGLYLKFLTHGPSPMPAADPLMRRDFDARPLDELVAELRSFDPVEAARINLANRRYVSRALEICVLSGRPASEIRDQWRAREGTINPQLRGILVTRPRAELHRAITERTSAMLNRGAIEEVADIDGPTPTLGKAIGFQEIRSLLAGEIDRQECEQRINTATRQYAKRQETWFRRETWLVAR